MIGDLDSSYRICGRVIKIPISMTSKNQMTVNEITAKFKSLKHFAEAYRNAGKLLVDDQYISWHYVKDVLTGDKMLLDVEKVKDIRVPPRYYE